MFLRLLTTEHRARAGPWDLIALVAAFALALVGVAWVSCAGELVGVAFTLLGVAWDRQARWPALVALVGVALVAGRCGPGRRGLHPARRGGGTGRRGSLCSGPG